jgi:hypothetical protein
MLRKKGDKVKIVSRKTAINHNQVDYRWFNTDKIRYDSFEPGMFAYCDRVATIVSDDEEYTIDIDRGAWDWTDEMFENTEEAQ